MEPRFDVLAAIEQADPTRARSPLRLWMRENYEAFAARLKKKRPDWPTLSRIFAEAGLTDVNGNPVKPETARKTWHRVVAERTKDPTPTAAAATSPVNPAPQPIAPAPAGDDSDDPETFFRPVSKPTR